MEAGSGENVSPIRKPPVNGFKPGQSGNPGGRPKNPFKHAGVAMRVVESFADKSVLDDKNWKPSEERQLRGMQILAEKNKDVQKELAKHYFARAFKELDRAEDGEDEADPGTLVERVLEKFRGSSALFGAVLRGALEDPVLVPVVIRAVAEAAYARPAVMDEVVERLGVSRPRVLDVSPVGGGDGEP